MHFDSSSAPPNAEAAVALCDVQRRGKGLQGHWNALAEGV